MKSRFLMVAASCLLWAGVALAQININTATKEELDSLKGIGEARAEAIIKYRSEHGPFKSVGELRNIPNFPDNLVDKLRGKITVGNGVAASAARPAPDAAKPMALPPARQTTRANVEPARPAAPAAPGKPAAPASKSLAAEPARPASPAKPMMESKGAAPAPAAPAGPAKPATPAQPANAAKPAAPAVPMAKPAAPSQARPAANDAAPASPTARPAAPAAPAKPAAPARPAQPAASY
jgi:competence protein ComEA